MDKGKATDDRLKVLTQQMPVRPEEPGKTSNYYLMNYYAM